MPHYWSCGTKSVFGIVGHSNLGLSDALRLEAKQGKLTFFGVRHEGAAAFACSGYGKLTGRPAACLTIAGPGATNLVTGLWDAKVDRAPVTRRYSPPSRPRARFLITIRWLQGYWAVPVRRSPAGS